jgi:hypothetical protein
VANTISCPNNLHTTCLQWPPFLHIGIIMPDFAAIESAFALLLDGYDLDGHVI